MGFPPIKTELWLNLYAFGQVDLKWKLDLTNLANSSLEESKATLAIGIELGFKIEASVKKVILVNGKEEETTVGGIKGEISGEAETGLTFDYKLKLGKLEGSVSFLGVRLKMVGYLENVQEGDKKEKGKKSPKGRGQFQLVKAKPDIAKFSFSMDDFIKD